MMQVLRESVDSYKPGEPVPSCQLELYWTKREQPPDKLKHRVKLTGVRHHTSITITRDPAHHGLFPHTCQTIMTVAVITISLLCLLLSSPTDTSKLPHSRKRPGSQHGEVEGTSSKRLRQSGEVAVAILSVFIADATDRQCVHNC